MGVGKVPGVQPPSSEARVEGFRLGIKSSRKLDSVLLKPLKLQVMLVIAVWWFHALTLARAVHACDFVYNLKGDRVLFMTSLGPRDRTQRTQYPLIKEYALNYRGPFCYDLRYIP